MNIFQIHSGVSEKYGSSLEMSTQDKSPLSGHRWFRILSLDTLNTLIPVSRQYASNKIICRWLAESISVSNGTRQITLWLFSHSLDARARNVGNIPHVIVPLGYLNISFCSVHDKFPLKINLRWVFQVIFSKFYYFKLVKNSTIKQKLVIKDDKIFIFWSYYFIILLSNISLLRNKT